MLSRQSQLRVEELERGDAPSALGSDCHNIHTTISATLTSLTATGGSTAGTISSGLLRGTTAFSATFTDAAGDYVGTLVITTRHGTLTLGDVGNLNSTTGQFRDDLTVVSGTGRFVGATGHLADQGTLNLQTGSFAGVPLTGMICLQHPQGE
jgi:PPE-repeat protein